jgi:TonB family protein
MVPVASVLAQAPDADPWSPLYAANNLDIKGNTPFHLKMTFQLYDLAGNPGETGTVEEWWASPRSKRVIVSAPSLKENGAPVSDNSPSAVREGYLVRRLIDVSVHPVPTHKPGPGEKLEEQTQKFGKVSLNCVKLKPDNTPASLFSLPPLCMQLTTDAVRFLSNGIESVSRNSTGKFHDTYVALDIQVSLLRRNAITGKITTLQSFDPAKSDAELQAPIPTVAAAPAGPVGTSSIPAEVLAGKRINFVQPEYPAFAKIEQISGSVLLHVIITKEGTVRDPVPIASSDPIFSDAATDAVRKWKYSPYLLNGEPREVDTTITVNFQLRP